MTDYGFDTASTVTSALAGSATSEFGNGFWGRYFSPSPGASVINSSSSNANAEWNAMAGHGAHHLFVITEPSQARLATTGSTGSSYGYQDAVSTINAVLNVYGWVAPLQLPTLLYIYLGLEANNDVSGAYWGAWAGYINGYQYAGGYPFAACLYCSPGTGNACATLAGAASGRGAWAIWSSEPEPCARCSEKFGADNSWSAHYCTNFITMLWQFGEATGCAGSPCNHPFSANFDIDAGHSEYSDLSTMFYT